MISFTTSRTIIRRILIVEIHSYGRGGLRGRAWLAKQGRLATLVLAIVSAPGISGGEVAARAAELGRVPIAYLHQAVEPLELAASPADLIGGAAGLGLDLAAAWLSASVLAIGYARLGRAGVGLPAEIAERDHGRGGGTRV